MSIDYKILTDQEIIEQLKNGAVIVHFLPVEHDKYNHYQIQMGDSHSKVFKATFYKFMKSGLLEYAGSEKDNNLIYTLK